MENARATTQETQARTNRSNTLLPYDVQQTQANTANVNAEAVARGLSNEATAAVPVGTRASGISGLIQKDVAAGQSAASSNFNQWYTANAARLDNLQRNGGSDQVDAEIARQASNNNLNPDQYVRNYGSQSAEQQRKAYVGTLDSSDPSNAAKAMQYNPHQELASNILKANERYKEAELTDTGATKRTSMETDTQKQIASDRNQVEKDLEDVKQYGANAPNFLIKKAFEASASGKQSYAERLILEAKAQAQVQGDNLAQKAYSQAFYQLSLNQLGMGTYGNPNPGANGSNGSGGNGYVIKDENGKEVGRGKVGGNAPAGADFGNISAPPPGLAGPGGTGAPVQAGAPSGPPSQPTPGGMPNTGRDPSNVGGMPGVPLAARLSIMNDELNSASPEDRPALQCSIARLQALQQPQGTPPPAPAQQAPVAPPSAPAGPPAQAGRPVNASYQPPHFADAEQENQQKQVMFEDTMAAKQLASNPGVTRQSLQANIQKLAIAAQQSRDPKEKHDLMRMITRLSLAQQFVKQ